VNSENKGIHIIFLEDTVLRLKEKYFSWRRIQEKYETHKASPGPIAAKDVIEILRADYGNVDGTRPFSEKQIFGGWWTSADNNSTD
jgi:hypothetical protein